MRSVFYALLLVACTVTGAGAQPGALCMFSDPAGTECSFTDSLPGVLTVFYVVHVGAPGATAAEFSAPKPACMTGATWLSDTAPFPVMIGNSQTGVSIGYGACLASPVHVLTINYFTVGTTEADCAYPILPHPSTGAGHPQVVDCDFNTLDAAGGVAYINSDIVCDCIDLPPQLAVSPSSLSFSNAETSKSLQIRNVGGGTLTWETAADVGWLSVVPASGSGTTSVSVNVDRTGLDEGTYNGVITVTSNGGTVEVDVLMEVGDPVLQVTPTALDFDSTATARTFAITNAGVGTLSWNVADSIPWLTASPTSGSGDATINVTVDRSGLAGGAYSGEINVASNGGYASVLVTMVVVPPAPALGFSPTSLTFPANTGSLSLAITNEGAGDLSWTISSNQPWLHVDPSAGVNDAQVGVTVDRTGLPDGTYSGELSIASNGGSGTVPVLMNVTTTPVLAVSPTLLQLSPSAASGTFQIENTGVGTLEWSLSDDRDWIDVDPPLSGTGGATVTVRVNLAVVPGGTQTGHVNVTSNGGDATVTVRFTPPSPSQPGVIGLYADTVGTVCDIDASAIGLKAIHVVHVYTPGATAGEFSAPKPACMTGAIWLSDTPMFPVTLGNSQTGVSIGYGACRSAPIHVLTINYFVQGPSEACCAYPVLPHPLTGAFSPQMVDCSNDLFDATGLVSAVNPAGDCSCALLKVEETTWGHIKAMYAGEEE